MIEKPKSKSLVPRIPDSLSGMLNSLAKIEGGTINSNDMLCRMLMIEGSPAWNAKGVAGTLELAQREFSDPDAVLRIDNSIYLHIAKKALAEADEGSSVGLNNARVSIEKAFGLASGSLKVKSNQDLKAMLPAAIPTLMPPPRLVS